MTATGDNGLAALSILIVDDDESLLDLVRTMLQQGGVGNIETTTDAREAIARLQRAPERYDIILSDLNMPGTDGIELMRLLADLRFRGGFILLTAVDLRILEAADNLAKAHGLHVLGVLPKPLEPARLLELIAGYCARPEKAVQRERLQLTRREMRAALDQGQFVAYFQPQVDLATRRVMGMETLLRWEHPAHGTIPARVFVPMAEEGELAPAVTALMLREAMQAGQLCRSAGILPRVSVNVPMNVLHDLDFANQVQRIADECGYPLSCLVLEITESQLMGQVTQMLDTLIRLRLKGVELAVDDFGTGYSNLAQLKQAPISELKIDRSFVVMGLQDQEGRVILEAAIALGRNLGLRVVAEGIEDAEGWQLVKHIGADEVQGDFIAQPMPVTALTAWAADWRRRD